MQIAHADAAFVQVFGQAFSHLFSQGCDEHALLFGDGFVDFAQQVVHLPGGGAHDDPGIQQSRGADELLHRLQRMLGLVGAGRGRYEHRLPNARLKFVKPQRAVIIGGGQAEAVIHEGCLSG